MTKRKPLLRYPLAVYKHWALNQWYYFKKPALKAWLKRTFNG